MVTPASLSGYDHDGGLVAAENTKKPNFDDDLRIAQRFPRPLFETWEDAAQRSLKGNSPTSLEVTSHEGLVIKPLYTADDIQYATQGINLPRRARAEVACPIDLRDPKGTIGRIVEARDCGADALWIWVDRRSSSWGKLTAGSFALFQEAAEGAPIYLDGRGAATTLAALLIASRRRIEGGLENFVGGFDIDPLGVLAIDGTLPTSLVGAFDLMAESLRWCEDLTPRMRTIAVSTLPHAKAGATAVQELSIALATTVAYLRAMEQRGIPPGVVSRRLRFVTAVGRDLFMETAKLRALRVLWGRIAAACDVDDMATFVPIHAIASPRCLTVRDPWVNLLRGTLAAYTSVIGGADVVTVLPFDSVAGRSDAFARRLAINTSTILREESHLDRVRDPAAGSYLVEKLTTDLCVSAWEEFQRIEGAGGMVNSLRSGALARELAESLAAKRRAVATLQEPVTGVSSFPDIEEEPIYRHRVQRDPRRSPDLVPTAVHRAVGADSGSFTAALEAAHGGISASELVDVLTGSDTKDSFSPVVTEREAQPFEALRILSDRHLITSGVRPRVFVASIGPSSETREKTTSITSLLGIGGIIAVLGEGLEEHEALAAAFAASGSRVAVICVDSGQAPKAIPRLAREFKALRARRVLVAASPGRLESTWREAGVDGFVHGEFDAVSLLTDLLEAEGVDRD
jgi:methylmalonyl-CoA mutase